MKLLYVAGPKSCLNETIEKHLLYEDIEFENPFSLFKIQNDFTMYSKPYEHEDTIKRFEEVFDYAGISYSDISVHSGIFSHDMLNNYIIKFDRQIHSLKERLNKLKDKKNLNIQIIKSLEPMADTDIQLGSLSKLSFINFRFGKMPKESYEKIETYLHDLPVYFTIVKTRKDYVWGFYFSASENIQNIDNIFATLHFERITIETDFDSTPKEIISNLRKACENLDFEIKDTEKRMKSILKMQKTEFLEVYSCLKYYNDINSIKKFAAYTENSFFFTLWADEKTAKKLQQETTANTDISFVIEEAENTENVTIPTKLKNNFIFSPFEEFVKMYGVPAYKEFDPTPLLAIIYTLLFGMMFGDLGHGAVLLFSGIILSILKKGGFIGKILIPIGISSSIFGILYGACFGFEGDEAIIKPLWFTPTENMTKILFTTVIMGIIIILICMMINIINGIRQNNLKKALFSQNGLAGIVFYILTLYSGILIILNSKNPPVIVTLATILSVLMIFLQEPLSHIFEKENHSLSRKKGSFFIQSFFKLFEILLSFVTNTLSFVRVGAFALNHAGMMSVVIMFMHQLGLSGRLLTLILGNILVIGLEGLIVGIQVLRLGFYEMFSRFYDGNGRLFKPQNIG